MVVSGESLMSFAQQQLWLVDQLGSGSGAEYLMHECFHISGPLDIDALSAAFTEIARRHEVLRTTYTVVDETPLQLIHEPGAVPLEVRDLSGMTAADRQRRITEISAEQASTPLDIHSQLPWRILVGCLGPDEAVLMVTIHHIAFDGWSWGVLARELREHYAAAVAGTGPARLEPLAVQYADFAEWQRERWETGDPEMIANLAYWQRQLAEVPTLELPTDRLRPAHWQPAGDAVGFTVPAELAQRLAEVGRTQGATPFMTHAAAFSLLLSRYSGQQDIAVGVSVAARSKVELEPLIGLLVDTVVLRTNLAGADSFGELLGRMRSVTLDAFEHGDVPYDQLVRALAPQRSTSRNPVFQASFAWHNAERVPFTLPGTQITKLPPPWIGAAFDISLHMAERQDGTLRGELIYPIALFDRDRVARMADNYLRLLAGIADGGAAAALCQPLVAETEAAQLASFNDRSAEVAITLPELFFQQADATPDAVAVLSGRTELTYGRLAQQVRQLSGYLQDQGIGNEVPVGVALHRGPDLVVALLAVLAAGGVYVPLAPDHPRPRTEYVIADSGIELILADSTMRAWLPAEVRTLTLDELLPELATAAEPVVHQPAARPGNLAYLIYTSGSTGKPKGVQITHAGIANRVLWSVRRFGLGQADRVLQKTTIGFDASIWEFLAPLVSGGAVVMADPEAHRDLTLMTDAIIEHAVTVLQLVPSVLRLLIGEPQLRRCRSLRLVCSAGEPLSAELCDELLTTLDVQIFNTYGPTECSIDSTAWAYRRSDENERPGGMVPIGAPLPNVRAFVVDADGQLAPIGVPGELRVAGIGVARGYAGRPDLTAERFTPNPYADTPGERWYATGDRARWRSDGALEFLGRIDSQVKVRGVRIEPAEVEAALFQVAPVESVVVTGYRSPSGDTELAAYLVPVAGERLEPEWLRERLAEQLPAPMIPAYFVLLDELPLGPNGKLDSSRLPAPEAAHPPAAPRTTTGVAADSGQAELGSPVQQLVCTAMAEVLGQDGLNLDDDFFAIGGHSLLAIRLVMRLRQALDIELSIADLFGHRTARALAAFLKASGRLEPVGTETSIQQVARDREHPLSFAQQRMWFLDQLEPGSTEYLIPLAYRISGPLDLSALADAVDDLVDAHEILRTRYASRAGEPVQIVDPVGSIEFTVLEAEGEARARELTDLASSRPFDLAREHPMRVTVARISETEHILAMTLHHIAFDAWSMDIFMRDLDLAYQARTDGRPSPLRAQPLQYVDFAVWQRRQQAEQAMAGQLNYWRQQLADLTPLELTPDRPRTTPRDPRGATVIVEVEEEAAAAVAMIARDTGATTFMVLLTAFTIMLSRYTGRTDVAVGTPVAGRSRQETEEVLGFFVNNVVLRQDLTGDPSGRELLEQVQRTVVDAFANQDLPFEYLVEDLRPERDLSRNPIFQVMFDMEHLESTSRSLGKAPMRGLPAGAEVSKFDLTLLVHQRPDGQLRCLFEYATGLFDRSTIERMAAHYLRLLSGMAARPETPVSQLPLLTEAEREVLLTGWSDPAADRLATLDPPERHRLTVPELFERQAALTPDAVATEFAGEQVSYRQLNERANRLAHSLRRLGVGPEVVVGSCLERSSEAVVALLGVLKAGGVYVPFDPQHPGERLNLMLADAGAAFVLTTQRFTHRIGAGRRQVLLDGEPAWDRTERSDNPTPLARPDNLAYMIYTSGSTGRPKAVMISHRSYAQHCAVIADAYRITAADRVVLLSALTFDVAMDQIAATLLTGATVIVSDPLFWTPMDLAARLAEHRVTIMEITPAYYRELMQSDVSMLGRLKLMNVGSDVVTVQDARRWQQSGLPGRFLCNYGPTEATVTCVLHPITDSIGDQPDSAALPIGTPVAGTRAYIVDAGLQLVPLGVPGELCLGGIRLARGYHNRPDLTADRFVPDPFSGEGGQRLYRTGDLVRYRQDGTIEFLGRIDQQVKIRGFRIELGEIEAALVKHPAVQAAVVTAVDRGAGDKRLAAYLVLDPSAAIPSPPEVGELRAHLRQLIPEYMIPSFWTTLPALPLTSSKKVDRRALPDPADVDDAAHPYLPPRNPVEQTVAEVWAEVLEISRVGAADNFFELGGHSLLATRVLARLQERFALTLPLQLLFQAATVADLATAITEAIEADIADLSDEEVAELLSREGAR